jgi:hypothetical protein
VLGRNSFSNSHRADLPQVAFRVAYSALRCLLKVWAEQPCSTLKATPIFPAMLTQRTSVAVLAFMTNLPMFALFSDLGRATPRIAGQAGLEPIPETVYLEGAFLTLAAAPRTSNSFTGCSRKHAGHLRGSRVSKNSARSK